MQDIFRIFAPANLFKEISSENEDLYIIIRIGHDGHDDNNSYGRRCRHPDRTHQGDAL